MLNALYLLTSKQLKTQKTKAHKQKKSVRLIEIFSALSVKKFFSTLMAWKSDHDFLIFFQHSQHSDFLANFCASFALQPIQIKKPTIDTTCN